MALNPKFAILLDGGFVKAKLSGQKRRFPGVEHIEGECARIAEHATLVGYDLLRIYFCDAQPASGTIVNSISGEKTNLGATKTHVLNMALQQKLELRPNFALRLGEAAVHAWKLGSKAIKSLGAAPRVPTADDFVPNIEQKGVDLRIGLDIARLTLGHIVDVIVVVTGDSDLVLAFKFARREVVRVYLDHMGHSVKRELKAHADIVL